MIRSIHDNFRGSTVTAAATPLIEARGLRVQFGKVTALDGLVPRLARPGQVLAILGPNGAGKTTFVRTVATLVPPSAGGALRVRGTDVTRCASRWPSGATSGWPASTPPSSPP